MPMRQEARPVATRSVNLIHREALGNIIRIQQRADPTCGIGLGTAARVENALNEREFGQGQTAAIESTNSLGRCAAGHHLLPRSFRLSIFYRQCFRAMRSMASKLRSTSTSVVAQDDRLIRIAVRPCQTVTLHQQVPSV